MISISQEVDKTLHTHTHTHTHTHKMLSAINLYLYQNQPSEKNNSLNREPRIILIIVKPVKPVNLK